MKHKHIALLLAIATTVACGIYAKPNVTLTGPIIGVEVDGHVMLQGRAVNMGTATAKNCVLYLHVARDGFIIESHTVALGDMLPNQEVPFEVMLTVAKFGDNLEYQAMFDWE
jgi:hypothetical protein